MCGGSTIVLSATRAVKQGETQKHVNKKQHQPPAVLGVACADCLSCCVWFYCRCMQVGSHQAHLEGGCAGPGGVRAECSRCGVMLSRAVSCDTLCSCFGVLCLLQVLVSCSAGTWLTWSLRITSDSQAGPWLSRGRIRKRAVMARDPSSKVGRPSHTTTH